MRTLARNINGPVLCRVNFAFCVQKISSYSIKIHKEGNTANTHLTLHGRLTVKVNIKHEHFDAQANELDISAGILRRQRWVAYIGGTAGAESFSLLPQIVSVSSNHEEIRRKLSIGDDRRMNDKNHRCTVKSLTALPRQQNLNRLG